MTAIGIKEILNADIRITYTAIETLSFSYKNSWVTVRLCGILANEFQQNPPEA
jgi:hypothetical protein